MNELIHFNHFFESFFFPQDYWGHNAPNRIRIKLHQKAAFLNVLDVTEGCLFSRTWHVLQLSLHAFETQLVRDSKDTK